MASPSWRVCLGGETATGAPARGFGLQQVDLQLHLQSPQRDQQSGNVWGVVSRSVVSSSLWSHGLQPTRLPHPWDSPGKNTGVSCHFLLQYMKVKSESEIVQSCPTLRVPMDFSLLGSSIHGIFQARVLEWGALAFSGTITECYLIMK